MISVSWFPVDTKLSIWYKIIFWWEIRRLLFNILLVTLSFICLAAILVISDLLNYQSESDFFFGLILFFAIANIYYTAGWVFQILTTIYEDRWMKLVLPHLMDRLILLTCIVSTLPILILLIEGAFNQQQEGPSYEMAYNEPHMESIIGTYYLSERTKTVLMEHNFQNMDSRLEILKGGNFVIRHYPYRNLATSDYVITKVTGSWEFRKTGYSASDSWGIVLNFQDVIHNLYNYQLAPFESYHLLMRGSSTWQLLEAYDERSYDFRYHWLKD